MSQHVVVVGAVALGPKAACRFKRLEPDSKVTMVDQSDLISYGGCGIPYFVSGDVSDASQLQSTSFHMVRDAKFFQSVKDIDVLTNTGVLSIDRNSKTVKVRNVLDQREEDLPYDQLVLATGSRPKRLPVPGADLKGVFTVSNLNEAMAIKQGLADGEVEKAVVIGAGAIGLEMAEALADLWGIETTVIEVADQILPGIVSPNIARMAQCHLDENDIAVRLDEMVQRLEGTDRVEKVTTDKGTIDADMVIMAVGVAPNGELAKAAGLEVSASGAIVVNERMQTSDPHIFAGGDCVEIPHLLTGKPGYFPSGSLANRQGRVIGTNLAGGNAKFEGAVGTFIMKVFEMSLASAGMSLKTAKAEGSDALSVFVSQFDRAHFYPEKNLMYMELIVDRKTEKVLGVQGLGSMTDAVFARVNAVAAILKYSPTTADISNLELLYAPPFSAAMDIVNALGNTAENVLRGKNKLIDVDQFAKWWQDRDGSDAVFLDCRGWGNAKPFAEKYPDDWKSIPQDELSVRMDEVPRDKPLVLICNTGVRSYEAQLNLRQKGITNTYNLQGGMATVKKWGFDLL
ncbi:MAG: FAD-dependent oxidoreductase [Deltaproteobacteria bacterium]|jgi:NADPH-dependent 2,4-dienoyl-CoA reductase/sulfur reductase-like enzyme/rhodanese-related sulfurtransferase|nr:FAD-dependent oxidoreductase [Deltaproteobacteria bacterium]